MSAAPEIRGWNPGDPPLLEAFAALPAERDSAFVPRTVEQWDWAFRASPGGPARIRCAWRGERPVALAWALPVRTLLGGEPRSFACLADARLAPGEPDATLAATLAELAGAHVRPEGELVHYGWPAERDAQLDSVAIDRVCATESRARNPR